ncbi:MAG TPA: DUF6089 family protein [Cytophagaceae bacterium]|jgi:hypothetical protein
MKIIKSPYLVVSFLLLISISASAQKFKKNRIGYIATGGVGAYKGEISPDLQSASFRPNGGVGVVYRLDYKFSFRSELNYFRLSGNNFRGINGLEFKSNNAELSTVFLYDLFKSKKSLIYRESNVPYLFAGLGITYYSPKLTQYGSGSGNLKIVQSNLPGATVVLPIGAGVKIKVAKFTDVAVECGYRQAFTDRLDNVREQFNPKTGELNTNTSLGSSINIFKNDSYYFANVKVIYYPTKLLKINRKGATALERALNKKNKHTSKQIHKNKKLKSHSKRSFASSPD